MKYRTLEFLKSKAIQFSPKFNKRLSEQTRLRNVLDEYHTIECKSPEAPTTKTPPQAIQGMWQAYGTIRGAMIRGWFSIVVTGVIGTGLFLYRLILSDQKKELKLKQVELNRLEEKNKKFEMAIKEKEEQVSNREKALNVRQTAIDNKVIKDREFEQSYLKMIKLLEICDQYVYELCGNDQRCTSDFIHRKRSVEHLELKDSEHETFRKRF